MEKASTPSRYKSKSSPQMVLKKTATTVYITERQQALLKELNQRTRVPVAEFIREGIDLVLERHRGNLSEQLELGVTGD